LPDFGKTSPYEPVGQSISAMPFVLNLRVVSKRSLAKIGAYRRLFAFSVAFNQKIFMIAAS
jgi:hypothetical protein